MCTSGESGICWHQSDVPMQGSHAASPSRLHDNGHTGSYGSANGTASRGSTSGFQVAAAPRAPQPGTRPQPGSSVHPSTGILSVQMHSANQLPSPVEATAAGPACIGFPAAASSGQGMSMLLPASITNNIWAVGDSTSDLTGSAEQRPHMWSSPSRGSPLRPSYVGPAPMQRPPLSTSAEIRRAAEASGLCCPLTKDLMSDPVVLISDGYTYERAAITKWLERNDTSPLTKAALQNKDMVPNLTMRSAIQLLIPSANLQRIPSQLDRRRN